MVQLDNQLREENNMQSLHRESTRPRCWRRRMWVGGRYPAGLSQVKSAPAVQPSSMLSWKQDQMSLL